MSRTAGLRLVAAAVVLVIIGAVVFIVVGSGAKQHHLTAEFPSTVSLYNGANVEILGVTVGKVTGIHLHGNQVDVTMTYNADHKLPTNVKAVIVPPSIVGDRFIELTPVYTGGQALADHATLPEDSTTVPVEIDQIYSSLNQLASALGPNGANAKGALSQLLTVLADNLRGNGQNLHDTLQNLSAAVTTLGNSRDNIAGSITHLSHISQTLATDDPQVRTLAQVLAKVSTELNDQDTDLSTATSSLNIALRQVATFVRHNRNALTSNIANLTSVTQNIAAHKADVANVLDLAPLALTDLWDSYVPENWDIAHPVGANINGITTATTARGNLLEDLSDQLGSTVSALCAELPAAATTKISALCAAIAASPSGLSGVLGGLAGGAAPTASRAATPTVHDVGPTSMAGLMLGMS